MIRKRADPSLDRAILRSAATKNLWRARLEEKTEILRFAQDDSGGVRRRDDVAGAQDDVAGAQDDVAGAQDDVAGAQDDVAGAQDDVAGAQDDMAGPISSSSVFP
jgi:hypothetical protein